MQVLLPLTGTSTGHSTAAATIRARVRFTGQSTGHSTASGTIRARVRFTGISVGHSTTSASLTVVGGTFDLIGISTGRSTASASITYRSPEIPVEHPAWSGPDGFSRMLPWISRDTREMMRQEREADTATVYHLTGRSGARSTTFATMRVRARLAGASKGRSTTRASIRYRVDRGQRKRDEELLLFLEAA
jgi:hypothetical protein